MNMVLFTSILTQLSINPPGGESKACVDRQASLWGLKFSDYWDGFYVRSQVGINFHELQHFLKTVLGQPAS